MGLKVYLQTKKLHRARRQLKLAAPGQNTVTAVAHQWEFWHLEQFSQDYKKCSRSYHSLHSAKSKVFIIFYSSGQLLLI